MSDQTRDQWGELDVTYDFARGVGTVEVPAVKAALEAERATYLAARAADVQTIATLQDENARLKAALEQARFAAQADTAEIAIAHEAANLLATKLATLKADAARREREALSHEDACVLSRIFNQYQLIQIDQYERINEFLKSLIESAFLTQRQGQIKQKE